ncbi:MAG: phosphoribosylformylglycinamidine synthase I [Candidatus Omnitrophica bacterium]|nr:phosphoribosylformylglycinamidine synthase I [Candidatus Omnitrophota bacterium]
MKPKVCILRTAGTNCDKETAFSFEKAGAQAEFVHINAFCSKQKSLKEYQILALSGGFSYGDDLGAGKVLANELKFKLSGDIKEFISSGKLIIGICNGFQILVKAGLLPGNENFTQEVSLIINDSGKFEDRWIYLKSPVNSRLSPVSGRLSQVKCIWAKNLPETIYLPVAHGEGKFITKDKQVLESLNKRGQVVFQYCDKQGNLSGYPDNPNGSVENIAGICDDTGRILGLMPHPERHAFSWQHPAHEPEKQGSGFLIIKNGVEYAKNNL